MLCRRLLNEHKLELDLIEQPERGSFFLRKVYRGCARSLNFTRRHETIGTWCMLQDASLDAFRFIISFKECVDVVSVGEPSGNGLDGEPDG
jgi:hypothetical protein